MSTASVDEEDASVERIKELSSLCKVLNFEELGITSTGVEIWFRLKFLNIVII
jgi:hypothetical protein